jgi:hypothetical protein
MSIVAAIVAPRLNADISCLRGSHRSDLAAAVVHARESLEVEVAPIAAR